MRHRVLLLCLLFSGFSGLAYELLWIRLLARSFGSATHSFATVLAVFFGGMALGSWLSGRYVNRIRRPLRAYAGIELLMAAVCLALYPVLLYLPETFAGWDQQGGAAAVALRFGVSVLVLAVPTVLMGATLPIACRATIAQDDSVSRGVALLYAANTFGACGGAFATTYWLLPALGLGRSMIAAAVVNVTAALIALAASRKEVPVPVTPEDKVAGGTLDTEARKFALVASVQAFLSGFSFIALEVVWTRIFSTLLSGTVYGVGAVLICVLFGIGIGGFLASRLTRLKSSPMVIVCVLWVLMLGTMALQIPQMRPLAYLLTAVAEARTPVDPIYLQLVVVALALAIPVSCAGACLPLLVGAVARRADRAGAAVGRLYSLNTVGSILGSLAAGFYLLPKLGGNTVILASFVAIVAAMGLALLTPLAGRERIGVLGMLAFGAFVVSTFNGYDPKVLNLLARGAGLSYGAFAQSLDTAGEKVRYFSEGETSSVLVTNDTLHLGLLLNGLGQGSRTLVAPHGMVESVLVAAVPLAHTPVPPKRALVVGLGAGITVDTFQRLSVPEVVVIDIEPKVAEAVDIIFEQNSPVSAPGVKLVIDDARRYLMANRRGGERFDVITSMPAHPWVASALFTREFFEIARDNLSPKGIFSTWFGIGRMDKTAVQSLLAAFTAVFPSYAAYYVPEAGALYLAGGRENVTLDEERYKTLFANPYFADYRELRDHHFLLRRLIATADTSTPAVTAPRMNTDDSMIVELRSPRRSKEMFDPSDGLAKLFPAAGVRPSLVRGGDPQAFVVARVRDLLEEVTADASRGGMWLAAAQADIAAGATGPGLKAWADGLVACRDLKFDEGRKLLERAAAEAPDLVPRLAVERVRCGAESMDDALAALSALPPSLASLEALAAESPHAALAQLASGGVPAPSATTTSGASTAERSLAWIASALVRTTAAAMSPEDQQHFQRTIVLGLLIDQRPGALRLALALANRAGLEATAVLLAPIESNVRVAHGRNLIAVGRRLATAGRALEAARFLERGVRLAPSDPHHAYTALLRYNEAGDQAGAARIREHLRQTGHSDTVLASVDLFLTRVAAAEKESKVNVRGVLDGP